MGEDAVMGKASKLSQELRDRAVRLVFEQTKDNALQWSVICSVVEEIGCTPEIFRRWARQAHRDEGKGDGPMTSEHADFKRLQRENRELKPREPILRGFHRGRNATMPLGSTYSGCGTTASKPMGRARRGVSSSARALPSPEMHHRAFDVLSGPDRSKGS